MGIGKVVAIAAMCTVLAAPARSHAQVVQAEVGATAADVTNSYWPVQAGGLLRVGARWWVGRSALLGLDASAHRLTASVSDVNGAAGSKDVFAASVVVEHEWAGSGALAGSWFVRAGAGLTPDCYSRILCGGAGPLLGAGGRIAYRLADHWALFSVLDLSWFFDDEDRSRIMPELTVGLARTIAGRAATGDEASGSRWVFGAGLASAVFLREFGASALFGVAGTVGREWDMDDAFRFAVRLAIRDYLVAQNSRTSQIQTDLGIELRRSVVESGGRVLEVGAFTGIGAWMGCLRGDFCGGGGANFGLLVAAREPAFTDGFVGIAAAVPTQLGLVNGVGGVLLPEARFELGL